MTKCRQVRFWRRGRQRIEQDNLAISTAFFRGGGGGTASRCPMCVRYVKSAVRGNELGATVHNMLESSGTRYSPAETVGEAHRGSQRARLRAGGLNAGADTHNTESGTRSDQMSPPARWVVSLGRMAESGPCAGLA